MPNTEQPAKKTFVSQVKKEMKIILQQTINTLQENN